METISGYKGALRALSDAVRGMLEQVPEPLCGRVREIRLRVGQPPALTLEDGVLFVGPGGRTCGSPEAAGMTLGSLDLKECFSRLSDRSVYARFDQIKEGYLSIPGGHRAGLCGRVDNQKGLCELSSINLRVARQIKGAAESLIRGDRPGGWLLVGPPGSGKTTVLRDMIRLLSRQGKRVCVVDCRGELAAMNEGCPGFDLGPNTDVLTGCTKAEGVGRVIRTMNPDYVAFDEIGTPEELAAVRDSLTAGVTVLCTLHAADESELDRRPVGRSLLQSGAMRQIAWLTSPGRPITVTPVRKETPLCG